MSEVKSADATTSYSYYEDGKLKAVSDNSGKITFAYDDMDGLSKVTYADGTYVSYTYDKLGRLTKLSTSYGDIGYSYDKLDRLTCVTDRNGNKISYSYDISGNLSSTVYANGIKTDYVYDCMNRLVAETVTDEEGNELEKYEYTFGNSGEKLSAASHDETVSYTYDELLRLTGETVTKADGDVKEITYTYDAVSNRVSKTENGETITYVYDSLNRLVSDTNSEYTYDRNGNLTSVTSDNKRADYSYDSEGRLIRASVLENGITATDAYDYDATGNRHSKTTTKTGRDGEVLTEDKVIYLNDISGALSQVIAELDEEGNLNKYYTRGIQLISMELSDSEETSISDTSDIDCKEVVEKIGDEEESCSKTGKSASDGSPSEAENKIATPGDADISKTDEAISEKSVSEAGLYYYVIDGHGSVRMLANESGSITDTYSYDAYGELTDRSGTTDNSYLYSGEYRDETTGLYYLRARYMDAETGRFITADSYQGRLSEPVSLHKYLYANANPVMYKDPSGYMAAEVISTSTAIAVIGSSVANAVALSIGLNLYEQLRLKDEYGTTIDIGSLLADAFMSGCIAAAFAAAAILGASLGSVAVMVAIGGSSLIFALLSFIAAYQAGECGYDDLALIYIILGCGGLYGADKCFDGAMNISKSQANASSSSTTRVDNSKSDNAYKNSNYPENPMTGEDWHNYFNEKYGADNVTWETASIDDIIDMPSKIMGFSPKQLSDLARRSGWTVGPLGKGKLAGVRYEQGGGFSMHAPKGSSVYIQYHPGGGHHGEIPYYKISSGPRGTVRYYIN